jgi:hypothetical protein
MLTAEPIAINGANILVRPLPARVLSFANLSQGREAKATAVSKVRRGVK